MAQPFSASMALAPLSARRVPDRPGRSPNRRHPPSTTPLPARTPRSRNPPCRIRPRFLSKWRQQASASLCRSPDGVSSRTAFAARPALTSASPPRTAGPAPPRPAGPPRGVGGAFRAVEEARHERDLPAPEGPLAGVREPFRPVGDDDGPARVVQPPPPRLPVQPRREVRGLPASGRRRRAAGRMPQRGGESGPRRLVREHRRSGVVVPARQDMCRPVPDRPAGAWAGCPAASPRPARDRTPVATARKGPGEAGCETVLTGRGA